jgi:hypothetical protein
VAWYSTLADASVAITAAITGLVIGAGGAVLKLRRSFAKDNSDIKLERSDARAGTWLNEALMARATQAETERNATMRAAKEMLDQRMVDVEKIARTEERLRHAEEDIVECRDRAQRAETRAAVAEDHMRKQAEQILVQSMNIDRLTTALARYDPEESARLAPKRAQQPLLIGDEGSDPP